MAGARAKLPDGWYAWPKDEPTTQAAERRVRCENCRHFVPDRINPVAGMAGCKQGLLGAHAMALHYCREFVAATPTTTDSADTSGACEAQS